MKRFKSFIKKKKEKKKKRKKGLTPKQKSGKKYF